jgi:hypothetical protein
VPAAFGMPDVDGSDLITAPECGIELRGHLLARLTVSAVRNGRTRWMHSTDDGARTRHWESERSPVLIVPSTRKDGSTVGRGGPRPARDIHAGRQPGLVICVPHCCVLAAVQCCQYVPWAHSMADALACTSQPPSAVAEAAAEVRRSDALDWR